jgi:ABC-type xylose transport system permease subunit
MNKADKIFAVLVFFGILWGVFGGYLIAPHPDSISVFGLPLTIISLILNAIFASCLCGIYFNKYWRGRNTE